MPIPPLWALSQAASRVSLPSRTLHRSDNAPPPPFEPDLPPDVPTPEHATPAPPRKSGTAPPKATTLPRGARSWAAKHVRSPCGALRPGTPGPSRTPPRIPDLLGRASATVAFSRPPDVGSARCTVAPTKPSDSVPKPPPLPQAAFPPVEWPRRRQMGPALGVPDHRMPPESAPGTHPAPLLPLGPNDRFRRWSPLLCSPDYRLLPRHARRACRLSHAARPSSRYLSAT